MPELPEVETVVRTLEMQLGKPVITAVKVYWPNIIANCSPKEFEEGLTGRQIIGYRRRGKFLIFDLDQGTLVAHLRMEGKFYVYPNTQPKDKHTHVIFTLADHRQIHYNDVRKFGKMWLYKQNEKVDAWGDLGYEPWDENLNGMVLRQYCHRSGLPIKTALLDQQMIAGIGNIYANEISFASGINPAFPARYVSEDQWDIIIENTRRILNQAIDEGGTTIRSYTSSLGVTGRFQQDLMVQSRENEPCRHCNTPIVKTKIMGRGTYYCPKCQRMTPVMAAVTGTIGSGKSEVMAAINEKGYSTISCDDINRKLLAETSVKKQLAKYLNCKPEQIERGYLALRIYNEPETKKQIEEYLHGLIWEKVEEFKQQHLDEKIIFVEVPLLFESGWDRRFGLNIVISADKKALVKRLKDNRGMTSEQIDKVLSNQLPNEVKCQKADVVLTNNSTLQAVKQQLDRILKPFGQGQGKETSDGH